MTPQDAPPGAQIGKPDHLWIDYTNHRGERAWWEILPSGMKFANNEWYWVAFATANGAWRLFSISSIHRWQRDEPNHGAEQDLARRPYGDGTVNHPPPETTGAFMDRVWGVAIAALSDADLGRLQAIATTEFIKRRGRSR